MTAPGTLICPKCRGTMTSYERNGITIDQCGDCRGIFLDRGELERLIDAEAAYQRPATPQPQPQQGYEYQGYRGRDEERYDEHGKRHKRGGFLSDLFD
jgi:Zn-finger nucleic acid-binding protein